MTKKQSTRPTFHVLSHGRRVAKHDEDLFRLIEFANLLTPRGDSTLMNRVLAKMDSAGLRREMDEQLRAYLSEKIQILGEERLQRTEQSDETLVEQIDLTGGLKRQAETMAREEQERRELNQLLAPIWLEARERFPHPTILLGVAVPGLEPPVECRSPEDLADKVLTVRRVLRRVAVRLTGRPDAVTIGWLDHPENPNQIIVSLPPAKLQIQDGKFSIVENFGSALIEKLNRPDIGRLRICRAEYRRTGTRCDRLFLALIYKKKNQQFECSPECADLRRHNVKRPKR